MPLVNAKDLLIDAEKRGYAVGAFNCNNMEILQAIVSAAQEVGSPVIIQASQGAIRYAGLEYIAAMGRLAAEMARVPVALHLDHGTGFEQVIRCIRHGFSSVMFDGSGLPFEENVVLTREVVKVARAVGVSVEGEIGRIGGAEDGFFVEGREAFLTDPAEAKKFVEMTGVDFLAVAVGTAHGKYRGVPKLDYERLEKIRSLVDVPLVLHGSSGVPDEDIKRAISLGVRKINIDTDIREAFVKSMRFVLNRFPDEIDPRKVLGPARDRMREVIQEKMKLFGCAGRV